MFFVCFIYSVCPLCNCLFCILACMYLYLYVLPSWWINFIILKKDDGGSYVFDVSVYMSVCEAKYVENSCTGLDWLKIDRFWAWNKSIKFRAALANRNGTGNVELVTLTRLPRGRQCFQRSSAPLPQRGEVWEEYSSGISPSPFDLPYNILCLNVTR